MKFKAKVFKLGNSKAMYIPKGFEIGKEYEFVYTSPENVEEIKKEVYTSEPKVYTPIKKSSNLAFCPKHRGSLKITCGCK